MSAITERAAGLSLITACINRRNDYGKETCFNVKIGLKTDLKNYEPVLYVVRLLSVIFVETAFDLIPLK